MSLTSKTQIRVAFPLLRTSSLEILTAQTFPLLDLAVRTSSLEILAAQTSPLLDLAVRTSSLEILAAQTTSLPFDLDRLGSPL